MTSGRRSAPEGLRPRPLSAAEESALARRIESGDLDAKETMILCNLGLVVAVARTYSSSRVAFADLVQEGAIGLVRAAERFDHRRRLKFSTYAVWWIRRSMLDAIASANVIRLPPKASEQLAAMRRAEAELGRIGPQRPSDSSIAQRTGLSVATVRSLRVAARVTASLDEPVGEDSTPLRDLVADDRALDPPESAIARENREEVSAMLRLLPERHREVLIRRYGLGHTHVQSHEEIGEWLGVGQERSRQIEREALRRLRSIAAVRQRAAAARALGLMIGRTVTILVVTPTATAGTTLDREIDSPAREEVAR
jgi:RNA polymerase primary sigma factor